MYLATKVLHIRKEFFNLPFDFVQQTLIRGCGCQARRSFNEIILIL